MVGGEFESLVILILQMWLYRPNPSHFKSPGFPSQNFIHIFIPSPEVQESLVPLAQFIRLFLGNFCATSKVGHLLASPCGSSEGTSWTKLEANFTLPSFLPIPPKPNFSTADT